jgi:hypothetical protein
MRGNPRFLFQHYHVFMYYQRHYSFIVECLRWWSQAGDEKAAADKEFAAFGSAPTSWGEAGRVRVNEWEVA